MRDHPALCVALSTALALLLLGGCSSPPQAPAADESKRKPANDPQAVELQVCRSELHNSRLGLAEVTRASESQRAYAQRLVATWEAARDSAAVQVAAAPRPNSLYVVQFPYGSTTAQLPVESAAALIAEAREAPLVLLRGRTDGSTDAPAETRIARERALAVRELLTRAGVPAQNIRATWQPSGDPVADNHDPAGRAANRRVEIEIYRALPMAQTPPEPVTR